MNTPPLSLPPLEHEFARELPFLVAEARPAIPAGTRVLVWNERAARELGIRAQEGEAPRETGGAESAGEESADARPRTIYDSHFVDALRTARHAMAYSGHQFGQYSPLLGDGRAHLLGEVNTGLAPREASQLGPDEALRPGPEQASRSGPVEALRPRRVDLHLKGSGLTPFSRPGSDGKAPLGAMLREYVIGEALAGLGIPSSCALAVLSTGEHVRRRAPEPEPAGLLVRVASSHLRVGTFQFAAANLDREQHEHLVAYALERHGEGLEQGEDGAHRTAEVHRDADSYRDAGTSRDGEPTPALTLLRAVARRQARLVAAWMGVGFVHGVLNTDNVTISGESIDFGPCAFIDSFQRDAVFSSIDHAGRYAYNQQPGVTQWNLARFAESLLDLIDDDPNAGVGAAEAVLEDFAREYRTAWTSVFARKLGLCTPDPAASAEIAAFAERTLDLLEADALDFTLFFRTLTDAPDSLPALTRIPGTALTYLADLRSLRSRLGVKEADARLAMRGANPVYVPRNHHLEAALRQAERGNLDALERLVDAVRAPFTRRDALAELETAPEGRHRFVSFCGT